MHEFGFYSTFQNKFCIGANKKFKNKRKKNKQKKSGEKKVVWSFLEIQSDFSVILNMLNTYIYTEIEVVACLFFRQHNINRPKIFGKRTCPVFALLKPW